jgi:tetratricopeptide (TPR) repeat protein
VAHRIYGLFLGTVRRFDDGIAEERRAEVLDPLTPPTSLGFVLTEAHRYDEAAAALKRALELEPDSVLAHVFLADTYRMSGRGDLAIAENRRALELGFPFGQALLAASYAAAGRKAEAGALLKESIEQSKRSHAGAVFIATAFAAMGEKDQALIWLEESYNEHDPGLTVVNALPFFDTLRADPRFQDLVRRIGIPTQ